MKLEIIAENVSRTSYYTVMPGDREHFRDIPQEKCWMDTNESIDAMSVWLKDFTIYSELIGDGEYSLYQFSAPKPTPLPIDLTLNYVDMVNADKLNGSQFRDAIKWLSQFDSSVVINSAYEDTQWTKGKATHKEIVKVLSDVVKSTGMMVYNPSDKHPEMKYQMIATVPVTFMKVNIDSILNPDSSPDFSKLQDKIVDKIDPRDERHER